MRRTHEYRCSVLHAQPVVQTAAPMNKNLRPLFPAISNSHIDRPMVKAHRQTRIYCNKLSICWRRKAYRKRVYSFQSLWACCYPGLEVIVPFHWVCQSAYLPLRMVYCWRCSHCELCREQLFSWKCPCWPCESHSVYLYGFIDGRPCGGFQDGNYQAISCRFWDNRL